MLNYNDLSYWLTEAENVLEENLDNGIVELLTGNTIPFSDISYISISKDSSDKYTVNINSTYGQSFVFKTFDTMHHASLFKHEFDDIIFTGRRGKLSFVDICGKVRNRKR